MFISFEGGEAAGKSTQIDALYKALKAQQISVIKTAEPGGTPGAEAIRKLFLNIKLLPISDLMLIIAARYDHIHKIIKPAIARNQLVLCDRYIDSTLVYQGMIEEIPISKIIKLHYLALDNNFFMPDYTVLLDIDEKIVMSRVSNSKKHHSYFDNKNIDFHRDIRNGFLQLSTKYNNRYIVIDANQSQEKVHRDLIYQLKLRHVF